MKLVFPSHEFDDAVAAVCHGSMSDEQARALNELLRSDAAARDEYILRVELHSRLASNPDLFARANDHEKKVATPEKIIPLEAPESSRKLILSTNRADVRLIIVRASDVPTYVQYGAADMGVAGKDVLNEHGGSGLYQPLDLNIARCRMMVAVRDDFDYGAAVRQGARLRVATKYLQTAREHFAGKGMHVDLIKLYGSMELAPLVGLSDAIVDVVSSGNTLKANHLKAVEEIAQISSRLVVNQASLKLKRATIQPMLDAFSQAVNSGSQSAIAAGV